MFCTCTVFFFFFSGIYAWSECTKKTSRLQWGMKKNECGLSFVTRLTIILQFYVHLKCMETDRQLLFIDCFFHKLQIIMKLMPKKGLEAMYPVFSFAKFSKRRCRHCLTWEDSYWFQQYINDIYTYRLFSLSKWTPRMIAKNNILIITRENPTKINMRCMVLLLPVTAVRYTKKKTKKEEYYFEENVLKSSDVINGPVHLIGFE